MGFFRRFSGKSASDTIANRANLQMAYEGVGLPSSASSGWNNGFNWDLEVELDSYKQRNPTLSGALDEFAIRAIERGRWSFEERLSLAHILYNCYSEQGEYFVDGRIRGFIHGIRSGEEWILDDIIQNKHLLSSTPHGIFNQGPGVYASYAGKGMSKVRDRGVQEKMRRHIEECQEAFPVYVAFSTKHPCIAGMCGSTTMFPLPEGYYIQLEDAVKLKLD